MVFLNVIFSAVCVGAEVAGLLMQPVRRMNSNAGNLKDDLINSIKLSWTTGRVQAADFTLADNAGQAHLSTSMTMA